MNPFLREHTRPLIGATLLHVAVGAAVLAGAWLSVAPKLVQPAAIEAYLAPAPRPHGGAVPPAAPPEPTPVVAEPAPPEPAPRVDSAAAERDRVAADAAHQADARRLAQQAEIRTEAARRQAVALETRHKAADARRIANEQALARKKAAKLEAQQRTAAAEVKRRTELDSRARAQRESDLSRQLAEEQHRMGAENAGLQNRYAADIRARIERAWNRPPSARAGLKCSVTVTQVPGGTVTDVRIDKCNGDSAVIESIKLAVFRASPLPAPPDPSLFARTLQLEFSPDE